MINASRRNLHLYSIFWPGPLLIASLFGASPVIFLITFIINWIVFLSSALIILFLSGNRQIVTFKRLAIVSFIITLVTDLYGLLVFFSLTYNYSQNSSPPLSYYFSPLVYNAVTYLAIPGLIIFTILVLCFLSQPLRKKLIVYFFIAVLNTSWLPYISYGKADARFQSFDRSNRVSRSEIDAIVSNIKIASIKEEIVSHQNSTYKSLRFTVSTEVPNTGLYKVQARLSLQENLQPGTWLVIDSPSEYTIEGKDEITAGFSGIELTSGVNELRINYPYVYQSMGKDHVNLPLVKRDVTGPYGPYKFQLYIEGYVSPDGVIPLDFLSSTYTTKQYSYSDFYK